MGVIRFRSLRRKGSRDRLVGLSCRVFRVRVGYEEFRFRVWVVG